MSRFMANKKCPASSCRNRKAIADLMLFLLIVVVAAGLIFFMGLFFGYVPLASDIAGIKTNLNVYMTNDDVGTEIVSLLNAKNGSVKHMERLGSYISDDYSDYLNPVKDTLNSAYENYYFTFNGISSVNLNKNVPRQVQDTTTFAVQCGPGFSPPEKISLKWPSDSTTINSGFGGRDVYSNGVCTCHKGVDINGVGNVYAAADGIVDRIDYDDVSGRYIVIKHANDFYSYYMHLSKVNDNIKPGVSVKAGDKIAVSGNTGKSTGPHLHFELRYIKEGKKDSIDPCSFFLNMPQNTVKPCDHEQVSACSYVTGSKVKDYETEVPLPGAKSGTVRGKVVFKQWE